MKKRTAIRFKGTDVAIWEVLTKAKQYYINRITIGINYGMCHAINDAILDTLKCDDSTQRRFEIELFNRQAAKEMFGAGDGDFWWPVGMWQIRIDYFNWLINEYRRMGEMVEMGLNVKLEDGDTEFFINENGLERMIKPIEILKAFHSSHILSEELFGEVWSKTITHNLTEMAKACDCDLYEAIWRPDELIKGVVSASDVVGFLREGLDVLKSDKERLIQFNPSNGWGNYDTLVRFVTDYIKACENYPDAIVSVER